WRINFYAMQDNAGVAWSPIMGQGNFHKASRFGTVLFAEQGWEPAKPAAKEADKPGVSTEAVKAGATAKAGGDQPANTAVAPPTPAPSAPIPLKKLPPKPALPGAQPPAPKPATPKPAA